MDSGISRRWKFFFAQIFLSLSVIFMVTWIYKFKGGLSKENPNFPWNLHPFFMTIAFVFCLGEAIVSYTILPFHYKYKKWIHATLHSTALLLIIVGIWAIIKYHQKIHLSHFFSLHSWFGLVLIILFLFQWFMGIYSYMFNSPSLYFRSLYLPIHRAFGSIVFGLGTGIAVMGLVEIQTYNQALGHQDLYDGTSIFGNLTAFSFLFSALVVLGIVFTTKEEERGEYSTLLSGPGVYKEAVSAM